MLEPTDPRLEYLFGQYFKGVCSKEEEEELLNLIEDSQHDDDLKCLMDQAWARLSSDYRLNESQAEHILSGILGISSQDRQPAVFGRRRVLRWAAAAATLLILLSGGWIWYQQYGGSKAMPVSAAVAQVKEDVSPGGNKAVLILGNGTAVVLDSLHNGLVTRQGSMRVMKVNGALSYKGDGGDAAETVYNTIVTPRGGEYQVTLPDGSEVWLNAASSLRFPTAFSSTERRVELTGEAYFEVAENKDKPFKVSVKGMEVKVLGTHFNVMAYDDEPTIKTTLLEGAVKVLGGGGEVVLKPGQQASLDQTDRGGLKISEADLQAAVAWKNGLFVFHNADIQDVMQEIGRWYNVESTYPKNIQVHLNGMIARNTNLSQVLHMLEVTTDIRFKIDGRKIMVLPSDKE